MFGKKKPFAGEIGGGYPWEDFGKAVEKPELVDNNIDKLRPMVKALAEMETTVGWRDWIQPYLEMAADPMRLMKILKDGGDYKTEVAKIELCRGILNMVGTARRTGEGIDRLESQKAAEQELLEQAEAAA